MKTHTGYLTLEEIEYKGDLIALEVAVEFDVEEDESGDEITPGCPYEATLRSVRVDEVFIGGEFEGRRWLADHERAAWDLFAEEFIAARWSGRAPHGDDAYADFAEVLLEQASNKL